MLILFYAVYKNYNNSHILKEFAITIYVGIGALLISLPQLLPAIELVFHSVRSTNLPFEEATSMSFNPYRLFEFLLPFPYGNNFPYPKLWISEFLHINKTYNWSETVYAGILPAILFLFSLIKIKDKQYLFWFICFISSLFLAFGTYNPVIGQIYSYFPQLFVFRYPEKIILFTTFSLSILSGYGFKTFFEQVYKDYKISRLIYMSAGYLLICVLIILFLINVGDFSFLSLAEKDKIYNIDSFLVGKLYYILFIILIAFLLTVIFRKNSKKNEIILITFIFITFLDVFYVNQQAFITTRLDLSQYKPEIVNLINLLHKKKYPPRVFTNTIYLQNHPYQLDLSREYKDYYKNYYLLLTIKSFDFLEPNKSIIYKMGYINNTDALRLNSIEKFYYKMVKAGKESLFSAFGNNYVVSLPENIQNYANDKYSIYKMNGYYLIQPANEVKRFFIVDKPVSIKGNNIYFKEEAANNSAGEASIKLIKYSSNLIQLNINLKKPAWLILKESYYPGWKAYINGKEVLVLNANNVYRAVKLNKGKNQVKFNFMPDMFGISIIFSLIFIIFLVFKEIKLKK